MLKQAMRGMFGKGMPDPSELSGKLDSKALQKAAKDLGNMSPNNIPGGLSGLGGGQLPQDCPMAKEMTLTNAPILESENLILRGPEKKMLKRSFLFLYKVALGVLDRRLIVAMLGAGFQLCWLLALAWVWIFYN